MCAFRPIAGILLCRAQEESRRLGVPNVYSMNSILYYETPNCELSRTDPYSDKTATGSASAHGPSPV
jgi:hypothetical protein